MTSKRFNGNIKNFHFNPIPLNKRTRHFFPNLETLHVYSQNDDHFEDDECIVRRVLWYPVDSSNCLLEQMKGNKLMNVTLSVKERQQFGFTIPSFVNVLKDCCFAHCTFLRSLVIPNSVTRIADYCFSTCASLTNIRLSSRLVSIGKCCFTSCRKLPSIIIPDSVTSIGDGCFDWCFALTSMSLSEEWKQNDNKMFNMK